MTDWCIPDSTATVDGSGAYSGVNPGDRLLIPSSRTTILTFRNLSGTAANPITIINADGRVTINDGSWVCFQFYNCEYLRLTGTGDPAYPYGFRFLGYTNSGVFCRSVNGVGGTRYMEIDHIEVGAPDPGVATGAGIRFTNEVADVPVGWIQYDTTIHHCYIHDTETEALYIGDGGEVELRNVDIYANHIKDAGWGGIQVRDAPGSGAYHVEIHHNLIDGTGLDLGVNQSGAAVVFGFDTGYANIHNNWMTGCHRGVHFIASTGDNHQVYNNVIIDAGTVSNVEGGIRIRGGNDTDIYQNTIVDAYDYGIRIRNSVAVSGTIEGNIICGTNSGNHIVNVNPNMVESENLEAAACGTVGFVDLVGGDYHITDASAAQDGYTGGGASTDYDAVPRPQEAEHDIGAYEFRPGLARDATGCRVTTVVGVGPQVQC